MKLYSAKIDDIAKPVTEEVKTLDLKKQIAEYAKPHPSVIYDSNWSGSSLVSKTQSHNSFPKIKNEIVFS